MCDNNLCVEPVLLMNLSSRVLACGGGEIGFERGSCGGAGQETARLKLRDAGRGNKKGFG